MKVILLAPTPPPVGGIAVWTMRMLKAKLNNNWSIDLVDEKILGKREVYGDHIKRDYFLELKRCLNIWIQLCKKLYTEDAKVVHACIPATTLPILREIICALISKVMGCKFIVHFRCTIPNMIHTKSNEFFFKIICLLSDCVMVLNKQSELYVKCICKTKVFLIPNFVEEQEIEKSHVIKKKIERVLYVGGVIESKGCIDLIEIARQLPKIEFRLLGNYDSKVLKASEGLHNVKLLGSKEKSIVHEELMNADVFAFIGYFAGEGFSNALAEAMACGVPCLVSDWAANKDMIENQGGIVIPIKDRVSAMKALEVMQNPKLRKNFSNFNIEKVMQCYSERVILDKYVKCYEYVIKGE